MSDLVYMKEQPRLTVKFLDGETKEVLFEVKDRDWMNIGELMTDHHVSALVKRTIKEENLPDSVIAMITGEYFLYEVQFSKNRRIT